MACLRVLGPLGERILPEGPNGNIRKRPDEEIIEAVWDCGAYNKQDELDAFLEREGIPWGTLIKAVTTKVGIRQCSRCTARQYILDQAGELGLKETVKQLVRTFR